VHLVGHSYGGATALRVALTMPRQIRSVTVYEPVLFGVLRDCYGRGRPAAEIWEIARAVRRHVHAGMRETAARIFIDYWSGAGTWDTLPEARQMGHAARNAVGGRDADDPRSVSSSISRRSTCRCCASSANTRTGRADRRADRRRVAACVDRACRGLGHMGPVTHPLAFAERTVEFCVA
jgi:pimeloyl-ACP methyl ester carboxylesterase